MKTKTCPVCDWEIKGGGIRIELGGKPIRVCCEECAQKARKSPAKYSGG